MDIDNVEKLLELMEAHGLQEVEIEQGDVRIKLRKSGEASPAVFAAAPAAGQDVPVPVNGAVPNGAPAQAPASQPPADENVFEVRSPMVGTFYRSPAPDADSFVHEGDTVAADAVVCIIEAMKVMNEIKAECDGEIAEILVENGESVEYGQVLMVIRKTGGT
jgi:acetyl-CoA carboxylase biotin carboxyl carrier protein